MKESLRKKYIDIRKNMKSLDKNQADIDIFEVLKNHPQVEKKNHIMVYVSTSDEVNTYGFMEYLLSEGKNLYVPVVKDNEIYVSKLDDINKLVPGKFNIGEPVKESMDYVEPSVLEVVIVPGVCFTPDGVRLGRGGGYYDRFLTGISGNVFVIGLCYRVQMTDKIPYNSRDIKAHEIITE